MQQNDDNKKNKNDNIKEFLILIIAEILTSNSVGTQSYLFGSNQDNNRGSNFITKKKFAWYTRKWN